MTTLHHVNYSMLDTLAIIDLFFFNPEGSLLMPFLKLGSIVFNPDYVVKMVLTDDAVIVYFAASEVADSADQILKFTGDQAAALKEQWIRYSSNVKDLMPPRSGTGISIGP